MMDDKYDNAEFSNESIVIHRPVYNVVSLWLIIIDHDLFLFCHSFERLCSLLVKLDRPCFLRSVVIFDRQRRVNVKLKSFITCKSFASAFNLKIIQPRNLLIPSVLSLCCLRQRERLAIINWYFCHNFQCSFAFRLISTKNLATSMILAQQAVELRMDWRLNVLVRNSVRFSAFGHSYPF